MISQHPLSNHTFRNQGSLAPYPTFMLSNLGPAADQTGGTSPLGDAERKGPGLGLVGDPCALVPFVPSAARGPPIVSVSQSQGMET